MRISVLLGAIGYGMLSLSMSAPSLAEAGTLTAGFSPTAAEIANPERGFYRAGWTDLDTLTDEDVADAYADGYRLLYARINLESFRTTDISATFLRRIEAGMGRARRGGVKLIIRAVYNNPANETEYKNAKDATLTQLRRHLAQLTLPLGRNSDVIAFVQAGFIGAWGEWHTSSNNLTTPSNRAQVRDALLAAIPASHFVQFRYPTHLQAWTPTLPGLDAAIGGTFRLGFHNDCFLASRTDVGTYDENATIRARQQAYTARLGELGPFGGETCNPADEPGATPRTACKDVLAEGARYHLTYLNDEYYRRYFHARWAREGCMAEIRRKMGYRFELVRVSHGNAIGQTGHLVVNATIRNSGWARLYNARAVQLVLRHRGSGAVRRIDTTGADPRRWLPALDTNAAIDAVIPQDLPVGAYDVMIALPDPDARLRADPRFAIRFANSDEPAHGQAWQPALGAFAIGTTVQIR